jgi:uncharacterized Tic20 family protein
VTKTQTIINNTTMNSVTLDPSNRLPIRIESAPAFGGGSMSADQEKTFVLLAHLFPLIIWPWKRKESPAVNAHGKEALNMGITLLIVMFPLGFISGLLGSASIAGIVSIITSLMSFAMLMLVVIGAVKAQQGWLLRYPGNLRLIK